jgi:type IV secretory pathway VirB10-like protein
VDDLAAGLGDDDDDTVRGGDVDGKDEGRSNGKEAGLSGEGEGEGNGGGGRLRSAHRCRVCVEKGLAPEDHFRFCPACPFHPKHNRSTSEVRPKYTRGLLHPETKRGRAASSGALKAGSGSGLGRPGSREETDAKEAEARGRTTKDEAATAEAGTTAAAAEVEARETAEEAAAEEESADEDKVEDEDEDGEEEEEAVADGTRPPDDPRPRLSAHPLIITRVFYETDSDGIVEVAGLP